MTPQPLPAYEAIISPGCEVLLVCEGGWDVAFLRALLARLAPSSPRAASVRTVAMGGKQEFRANRFNNIALAPGFRRLRSFGVILDANGGGDNAAARTLAQINEVLRGPLGAPPNFLRHGEVKPLPSGGFAGLSVGAFVMPDGKSPGALEDLLRTAVGKSHPQLMKCADEFLACARQNAAADMRHESKKAMQAFYAGLPDHCPDLNAALREKHIVPDAAAFDNLRAFLQKLAAA